MTPPIQTAPGTPITPVPELVFESSQVRPDRLWLKTRGLVRLELHFSISRPQQLHVFQDLLSQFAPAETLQALAYLPSSELRLVFEARPEFLEQLGNFERLGASDFRKGDKAAPLALLSENYRFKQYETHPVA